MYVTVNLLSKKPGEIKNFLESYYQKKLDMDNDVGHWIYVYYKPLQAIDLISTVIDNSDKHKMTLLIQVDKGGHPYSNIRELQRHYKGTFILVL